MATYSQIARSLFSLAVVLCCSAEITAGQTVQCTTCKAPIHSWDTVPVSFHSAAKTTNSKGEWAESDLEIIKKFPLVTLEKWQGVNAVDDQGRSVFLWEEDAWVNAARQIKSVNPNISVIVWMDTIMVYTGWNVNGSNTTVNTTLNPDAQSNCATGHFRPAEFLEREGQHLLLRNATQQLAINDWAHCHIYDHTQPAGRKYWTEMCLNMTASGVIDGCGADFSSMDANVWSAHNPTYIAKELGLTTEQAAAWGAGHRQMMKDTQAALGNGLLIGKDPMELGDHLNGVIQESGCYKRNATVNGLRALTERAKAFGPASKSWVYQCHAGEADESTIAAFLAGAGDGHFLVVGGWSSGTGGHWTDDFAKPLGPPLGDAVYNGTSWLRSFASGTKVVFTPHVNAKGQDMGGTGTVEWAAQ